MNYDLTGGNPSKPMPIEDNFKRDDWGGQIMNNAVNPGETNQRLDVNGSDNKPFPQERNFTRDNDPSIGNFESETVTQEEQGNVANQFGQIKYARREGATSIYKDITRNTENDNKASAKAEGSYIGCSIEEENEESQGI